MTDRNKDTTHDMLARRSERAAGLQGMRDRIIAMRNAIHDGLKSCLPATDLSRYLDQRGMFTYTGLAAEQVDQLRAQHGIYLLRSGRMCVAGLNESNVQAVAAAIASVMSKGGPRGGAGRI